MRLQQVVARDGRGRAFGIVEQRAHAGVRPHHVGGHDGAAQVAAEFAAQVGGFVGVDGDVRRVVLELDIGGADQGEVALVGDRENDAAVSALEDVGMVVLEELAHDDVAALDQPQRARRRP